MSAPEDDDGVVVPDDLSSLTGEVPDDLSALTGDEAPSVALVVTQVALPEPLAAACALAKVDVDVVPSPVGAIAVLREPAQAADGAQAVSRLLRQSPVVLLERRSEAIAASQWANGERGADLPPGLVLSDAPSVLEDLLLGSVAPAELDGVVTSVGLSRWRATRILAAGVRRGRS
ncbi:hypothetical protein [Cellulomonas alba]|uniref:Uncharacterized protein n=1 Tax=Cellulomonas alba TaxID=3053467 RepID=A0ABT7SJ65_9CELL|nr:hypothetical protein [Cellulomonas alba]MDM7856215.1 hypothetical protein [Cellulomonas alba]